VAAPGRYDSAMRRKLIIDVDPGIDDAIALAAALFDPRLEVLAVTATGGNVPAGQASANLQALVTYLDPPRIPRIGIASEDGFLPERAFSMHGPDGLGGVDLPAVPLHGSHAAEKVIWETIRAHPHEVTILCLGPLTNLSRLLRRDPAILELLGDVLICGGTLHANGGATPAADFNFYCDPLAARHVISEPCRKTLLPLETSSQVVFGFDMLDQIPDAFSRAGRVLQRMLPHAFRAHRQFLGSEGIHLHDVVALVAVTNPELFRRQTVAADVETGGELTAGMLVIDRRQVREWKPNLDMLISCDVAAVKDCILRGLMTAADAT
jgi:inosine-uridine nucleoside N-ribohydrolase